MRYAPGAEAAALRVAAILEIGRVRPGIPEVARGARLVVIVGSG